MKQSCYNPKKRGYHNWGGRGIIVCEEWLKSFKNFYEWSLENGYANNLSIDRINNDGNYEPNNCRWVTHKQQCNNTRYNFFVTINGVTRTSAEWEEISCIPSRVIRKRARDGLKDSEILEKYETHIHYGKIIQKDLEGNTIKIWNNLVEIVNELNLQKSLIVKVCRGKRNKTGGFKWEYYKEEKD